MSEEDRQKNEFEVILPEEKMGGVWANFARVSHTPHEFTLDFIRTESDGSRGIVVSRVSVSPLFVSQFIEALNQNWSKYAEKAMPNDLEDGRGGDGPGEAPSGG